MHILVILVVALIVFGPHRLPEAGRQVGRVLAELRRWSDEAQDTVRAALDVEASTAESPAEHGQGSVKEGGSQPLSPEESDRFARVLRLVALAEETFGDRDKARLWLRRPNRALEGRVPLDLLDTDGGARAVETILSRITHGVYS